MKTIRRIAACALAVLLQLVFAASPAHAGYASWSYVAQIDDVYCYGRLGMASYGSSLGATSEIYAGYWSNNTWTPAYLPAGWLYTWLQVFAGSGDLRWADSEYNTTLSDRATCPRYLGGAMDGVIYFATGGGNIYNWHSGSRISGNYAYAVHTHTSSRGSTSIIDNALSCADDYWASVQSYPQTASGETYGSLLYERQLGRPDWISARAANGERGYINANDYWVPTALNPADAVANFSGSHVRTIPVYDEPGGTTVVGYFDMHYGGSSSKAA